MVHTPDRQAWGWDSPLIGRCGYMRVRFSVLSFVPFFRYPAKEVYSVSVGDIQMFVEKRANVFNYMLLDASLDLPDPKKLAPVHSAVLPPGSPKAMKAPLSPVGSDKFGSSSSLGSPPDAAEEKVSLGKRTEAASEIGWNRTS